MKTLNARITNATVAMRSVGKIVILGWETFLLVSVTWRGAHRIGSFTLCPHDGLVRLVDTLTGDRRAFWIYERAGDINSFADIIPPETA